MPQPGRVGLFGVHLLLLNSFKQQQGNNMKPFQQATPQVIIVAGAGNSAGQAAMFVSEGAAEGVAHRARR